MSVEWIEIGPCRIACGDCLEILPTLEAGSVDAVVTDPPYGIFDHGGKWGRKVDLQWDKEPAKNIESLIDFGQESIIWGGNYFKLPISRGWLVWFKRDAVPSAADVELAWTSLDMNSQIIDQTISATNAERCGHPTQKPLRVMEFSLSFVRSGITVLDPFMGSGTTGVACIRTGRKFIGIEKEPRYFDIARKRLERAWQDKCSELPFEPEPQMVQRSLLTDTSPDHNPASGREGE
ncbi:MAG: DNA methyltransferase [Planctomycetaceae bacterium]